MCICRRWIRPAMKSIGLLTPSLANWLRSSPILICTLAVMRLMPASGSNPKPFRPLCSSTSWRTLMRCRPTSIRSWRKSSSSISVRWWVGMRSIIRRCRAALSSSPGRGRTRSAPAHRTVTRAFCLPVFTSINRKARPITIAMRSCRSRWASTPRYSRMKRRKAGSSACRG
ncbi:hypothetical protein D3C72_1183540 [compost metagenome]